jgi:hypothetical protein
MCDAPPLRKNKIVDFAFPPVGEFGTTGAAALPGRPKLIPASEQLDATKKERRDADADFFVIISNFSVHRLLARATTTAKRSQPGQGKAMAGKRLWQAVSDGYFSQPILVAIEYVTKLSHIGGNFSDNWRRISP